MNKFPSGWRFGTFIIFPYIGNNHPNGLIFFRGVEITNQLSFAGFWSPSLLVQSGGWPGSRAHRHRPGADVGHQAGG